MEKSLFEKIADREIPAYIVDETDEYMAFLDIHPACFGQTLVIPKKYHDSYVFNNDAEFLNSFMEYVRKIAKLLDTKLGSSRCVLMFEGLGVNHLHAKLFPLIDPQAQENGINFRQTAPLEENLANEILSKLKS